MRYIVVRHGHGQRVSMNRKNRQTSIKKAPAKHQHHTQLNFVWSMSHERSSGEVKKLLQQKKISEIIIWMLRTLI
ncbi:CLUMA_CG001452, isoform A [Clunio marinus]|uniref:CLUMA_CG001452, isoform A n=1 Tax=Clunio marinus TaxID=568069 RepID=A0A1J1HIC9_9DIPT|nr:CLUMA_CG001452, isoform A [Clunio marinus]